MVLWGGLRPIASRVLLDTFALVVWTYGAMVNVAPHGGDDDHGNDPDGEAATSSYMWVLLSCIFTVLSAGNSLTNRWTLTLPMVPYLVLQGLRRVIVPRDRRRKKKNKWLQWAHTIITVLSLVCILLAGVLCVLFPAVELPPIKGPYNVGKVDLFLPLYHHNDTTTTANSSMQDATVWVRLLYPTLDPPRAVPYLLPSTAADYCLHTMAMGAPPALKPFDWILHTWRLTNRMEASDGASLLPLAGGNYDALLPTVVFSHGLGGHADIYSYQTHSLAAHGNVVLTITHSDGSSPIVDQKDGSKREYDYYPQSLEREHGYFPRVVEVRRNQTEMRVQELVAVTRALQRWNKEDIHGDLLQSSLIKSTALSLKGRLHLERLTWAGHSFGGATVLTAAHRYPELVSSVIAHEPAIDWAHPSAIASLFAKQRIANLTFASTHSHEMFGEHSDDESLHHSADTLLLFSHEWVRKKWAQTPLLEEMHKHGRLGSNQTMFAFDYIPGMHHTEFSDTSMLMPTWLARAVGVTGSRNPIDTAREVAERTRAFLQASRQQQHRKLTTRLEL